MRRFLLLGCILGCAYPSGQAEPVVMPWVAVSKDKKGFVASSRGNVYAAGSPAAAFEHHESYLLGVLSFIGLTDVTVVRAEGLAFGAEAKEAAMLQARANIAAMAA